MENETITARVFAALNVDPASPIDVLEMDDKRSTVTAARNFWRNTRHKTYVSSSAVSNPVQVARDVLLKASRHGLSEADGRDLAIDSGVAHGTAFAVAAQVYRDFRRRAQPVLTGSRGTWTVTTPGGLELPVCHNIRVDWSRTPPAYTDTFKKLGKKYERWIASLESGYAVIQKGKIEDDVETRWRDSYLGIYQIDGLKETFAADGETANVSFRLTGEADPSLGRAYDKDDPDANLLAAVLVISNRAQRTVNQSGKVTTRITKWKEFGFESVEHMAEYLIGLYHRQSGKCALSGVRMNLEAGEWCISPDRIDSNGDYTPENVQLVANCVNAMKGATPNDKFLLQLARIKGG
ncbi:hypothetical protein [Pseudosulfitobacter pseudonitzschiae]|uniref:hypothetical protein n=1 Tax=Pseudosulfitobacter pseudonitzschiae TaxID=1402135 RepID=UPI003B801307